ncbi:MAG: ferredoxin [Actinomycetota bacterium]
MKVWIDQDLCTGDGLCVDHCPEVFVILEDGIAYVREGEQVMNDPGGAECVAEVPVGREAATVDAALDCPGECIYLEVEAVETGRLELDVAA